MTWLRCNIPPRRSLLIWLVMGLSILLVACRSAVPEIPDMEAPEEAAAPAAADQEDMPDTQYKEAPVLQARVLAGELSNVDERLPLEPLVITVEDSIGTYGGQFSTWDTGFDTGSCQESTIRRQNMLWRNPRTTEFEPNVITAWSYNDAFTELTLNIRRGLKWSDGEPVTSADALFWFADITSNEELSPQFSNTFTTVGPDGTRERMQVEALDDFTYKLIFAHPNPAFIGRLASNMYLQPGHYLQQFHAAYNEDAEQQAKDAGWETWMEYFGQQAEDGIAQTNSELPMLVPWALASVDSSQSKIYERNPYFWKVDAEGQQLPYMDSYLRAVVESGEVGFARALTGEWTFSNVLLPDVPLASQNMERSDFDIYMMPLATAADGYAFSFNYTSEDPELRAIFNDLRFRRAISHSMNRDEWNELFHAGLGIPRQAIPGPDTSFYEEGIDKLYIEFDVELANQLLDEIGLEWPEGAQYRNLPSGQPFILETQVMDSRADKWEIMKKYWETIGIGLEYKPVTAQLLREQLQTNALPIGSWGGGGQDEFYAHTSRPIRYMPPWHWPSLAQGGALWGIWHDTGGAEGEEPPELIQHLFNLVDEWLQQPYGSERYLELGAEIIRINAENLWWFGVIGYDPTAKIVDADLRNLATENVQPTHICGAYGAYLPEQWYFAELD